MLNKKKEFITAFLHELWAIGFAIVVYYSRVIDKNILTWRNVLRFLRWHIRMYLFQAKSKYLIAFVIAMQECAQQNTKQKSRKK